LRYEARLKTGNVAKLPHSGEITSTGGGKVLALAAQLLCHRQLPKDPTTPYPAKNDPSRDKLGDFPAMFDYKI